MSRADTVEVIVWPDYTWVLADDFRPEDWDHMSDDYQRITVECAEEDDLEALIRAAVDGGRR